MIKVCCLSCGHSLTLGESYDDYAGKVRCWGCGATLVLALQDGRLRSMHVGRPSVAPPPATGAASYAATLDLPGAPARAESAEVDGDER